MDQGTGRIRNYGRIRSTGRIRNYGRIRCTGRIRNYGRIRCYGPGQIYAGVPGGCWRILGGPLTVEAAIALPFFFMAVVMLITMDAVGIQTSKIWTFE